MQVFTLTFSSPLIMNLTSQVFLGSSWPVSSKGIANNFILSGVKFFKVDTLKAVTERTVVKNNKVQSKNMATRVQIEVENNYTLMKLI